MGDMHHIGGIISGIVTGMIALAIVAVIVSQRGSTASVIGSSGGALANVIAAAVSPVTGQGVAPNLSGSGSTDPFGFLSGSVLNPMSFIGNSSFGSVVP